MDGDYFKDLEKRNEIIVLPYYGILMRLDGKNFSNFTSGFKKPFDKLLTNALVRTVYSLIDKTNAKTAFCCSDEITLVFPPLCTKEEFENDTNINKPVHTYSGRVVKLCSIYGSYCSIYFNKFLKEEILKLKDSSEYTDKFLKLCNSGIQVFDARIIPFDSVEEVYSNLIWRSLMDCRRNSISQYGSYYLGKKTIFGKKSKEVIDMLKNQNFDWYNFPLEFRYGLLIKKKLVNKKTDIKGKIVEFQRGECEARIFTEEELRNINKNIFFNKYWDLDFGKIYLL